MTGRVQTRYEVGLYQAAENALLMDNGLTQTTRKVIIVLGGHGSDGTSNGPSSSGFYFEPIRSCVDAAFTMYNINAAGGTAWGNPASVTALGNAINRMKTKYSVNKVALFAASMRGLLAVNALKTLQASICGVGMLSPALDLDWFHGSPYSPGYSHPGATSFGAYAAEMETAYGTNAAGWDAATAGSKVRDEYATWVGKGPIKIWHGDSDATCPIGATQAFCTASGATLRTLVGAGHIPPLPAVGGPPQKEYSDFFNSLTWS